jgi:hypothetical protein
MIAVPEIAEALVIHPGDKLLVRVDRGITLQEVDVLREGLSERFPEVEWTVIIADQLAVIRG